MSVCNAVSVLFALLISSFKSVLVKFTRFVKLSILVFIVVMELVRLLISFLILVLKEADEMLMIFLFKLIDEDNLFSVDVARDVSKIKDDDKLSMLVCKVNESVESLFEIDWIDAFVFVDNALATLDTSTTWLLNLLFSYDAKLLMLVLKLTI